MPALNIAPLPVNTAASPSSAAVIKAAVSSLHASGANVLALPCASCNTRTWSCRFTSMHLACNGPPVNLCRHIPLAVVATNRAVLMPLAVTGLDWLFALHPDLADALAPSAGFPIPDKAEALHLPVYAAVLGWLQGVLVELQTVGEFDCALVPRAASRRPTRDRSA